jgi:hypothetical protein
MKVSKHVDFTADLEFNAWNRLKLLNTPAFDCPHFCEVYEKVSTTPGNTEKCLFFKEISIVMPNKETRNMSLGDIIFEDAHHPIAMINCVNQTIAAILMLEKVGITHYDLHSDNVMVTNTPFDVHVYITNDNILPLETHGITPVIIDFGVAYVPGNLNATTVFADSGFTSFMSDPLVDARLLITTVEKDVAKYMKKKSTPRPSHKTQKHLKPLLLLRKYKKDILDKTFAPLKPVIDIKTGWLRDHTLPNIIDDISIPLKMKSGIAQKENMKLFLDLLQHRVGLPLKNELNDERGSFRDLFLAFLADWVFVEQCIRNTKEEFMFVKDLLQESDLVRLKHRYPKIKNLFQLQTHLFDMGNVLENMFIRAQKETMLRRDLIYSNLECKTTSDIFNCLPKYNIEYKPGMKILIFDMRKQFVEYRDIIVDNDHTTLLTLLDLEPTLETTLPS